jgi:hypothetical protein
MKELRDWYGRLNPRYRFAMRSLVIGLLAYFMQDLSDGEIDSWDALYDAAKVSLAYTVLGLLTPLEPFVGVNKPVKVEVPVPPATPENAA